MTYPDRAIFNGSAVTYEAVDDAWVLANKPNTLLLMADKTTVLAADPVVDVATVMVQLCTPMLTDGSYDDVALAGDVVIAVDGENTLVTLDGTGAGSFAVGSVEVGSFILQGMTFDSNIVTIEAV